ncbi:hypothetical protein [Rhizobium phage RHEph12]|nr:hypothetical protein [Rhizobium phage RHEph12]
MSNRQRIIVRLGVEAAIPSLHFGELSMDVDTKTLRLGDDTPNPIKIMGTKSTGDFDFSSTGTVTFNNINFAAGGGIGGISFDQLAADEGIVISLGGGDFRQTKIVSSDGSVIVSNGDGQAGDIDIRVSSESITNALTDIRNNIQQLQIDVAAIEENFEDRDDSILKAYQLIGRPEKSTDLGTFLGNIIPDDSTVKTALQSLETALEASDVSQIVLSILSNDADQLTLHLKPGNDVTLHPAVYDADNSEFLAGLLSAEDKRKLDLIFVTQFADLDTIGIQAVEPLADKMTIRWQGDPTRDRDILAVTDTLAGVMLPDQAVKVNHLTITEDHDIDDMETRLEALEANTNSAFLVAYDDVDMWISDAQTSTTYTMVLNDINIQGYAAIYERVIEGFEAEVYDAITLNGIEIVKSENVTKSYSGAVTIFRAKTGDWYYTDHNGIARQFAASGTTSVDLDCGTTNFVRVQRLAVR